MFMRTVRHSAIEAGHDTATTPRRDRCLPGVTALLLALSLTACAAGDQPGEPPLATVTGSAQANALGISSWQVMSDGDDARIVGLDDAAARRAEVIVRRDVAASDDRVQIEAVFPEHGVFALARGGAVDGAASDLLRQLGAAITADLGEPSIASAGTGTATAAVIVPATQLLQGGGTITLGWSLFGYRANVNVDSWCGQGTRDHYTAFAPGGASCWVNRWTTDSPYDCTINLHYGIGGGHSDTCNWSVYTNL